MALIFFLNCFIPKSQLTATPLRPAAFDWGDGSTPVSTVILASSSVCNADGRAGLDPLEGGLGPQAKGGHNVSERYE